MAELENLSDEQLNQMAMQKLQQQSLENLSDAELDQMVMQKLQQPAQGSYPEAFLQSFGQTATMGYLPQLQAAAAKGMDLLLPESDIDRQLKEQGFTIDDEEDYVDIRDKRAKEIKASKESYPGASMLGTIAGAGATALGPGAIGAAGKGVSTASKLGQAAKVGGIYGALANPGDIEGEVSPIQPLERAKGGIAGALTGAGMQGIASGAGSAYRSAQRIPGKLRNFAEMRALKSSGAMLKDFRKLFGNKKAKQLGRAMLDEDVVRAGDDIAAIARRATLKKSKVGNRIGKIYNEADEFLQKVNEGNLTPTQKNLLKKTDIDLDTFAQAYKNNLRKRVGGKAGSKTIINRISKELDDIAENGKVPLKRIQEIRRSIDDQINFAKANQELKPVQQEFLNMRNKLQDLVRARLRVVDKIKGSNLAQSFNKANQNFTNLAEVADIASDRVSREQANRFMGLSERIQGGAGAVVGGMVGGVPGALAGGALGSISSRVARNYGTPVVAKMADATARILEQNPALLGKFAEPLVKAATQSPQQFVLLINQLKNDPEFLEMYGVKND